MAKAKSKNAQPATKSSASATKRQPAPLKKTTPQSPALSRGARSAQAKQVVASAPAKRSQATAAVESASKRSPGAAKKAPQVRHAQASRSKRDDPLARLDRAKAEADVATAKIGEVSAANRKAMRDESTDVQKLRVEKGRQVVADKPKESIGMTDGTVHADHQRRTCIEVDRDMDQVRFIALDTENGLNIALAPPKEFDARFKPLVDYPIERAAKLYVEYARGLGATEQVMRALGRFTTVNHEDIDMATKKKTARAAAPVKKAVGKSESTAAKKTTAPATKTAKKAAPAKAKGEKKARGPSAASRFQELIMEGKKTDDQIFAVVQKEFGLDDSKKSYVKWYRKHLEKQGKKPPKAKE